MNMVHKLPYRYEIEHCKLSWGVDITRRGHHEKNECMAPGRPASNGGGGSSNAAGVGAVGGGGGDWTLMSELKK